MDLIELLGVTLDRVVVLLLSNEEVPSSDKFRSLNIADVLHRHLLSHHDVSVFTVKPETAFQTSGS